MNRVTLLTDFGTADGYAAAMAGVLAAGAPNAVIESATHAIPPGDVTAAALTLYRYAFLYPPGTVHLVVVDPGVGTPRAAIAATLDGRHFVAPDNGALTRVWRAAADRSVVSIDPAGGRPASATFHGRDIFAPAAARLAAGEPLERLGPPTDDVVLLDLPDWLEVAGGVRGEVIQVDRFGTLISNIPADRLPENGMVSVGEEPVGPVRRTYGDVRSGELVALVGSLGLLEVSVRDGSAADRLGAGRGASITCRG